MPPKPATMKSNQPFVLTLLTNRIKKCSGCGLPFCVCKNSGTVPDYILGHIKRDWFPSNGQWQIGKLHNKYCITTYKEAVFFNAACCTNFHRIVALLLQLLQQCQCQSRICFTGNSDLNCENWLVVNKQ